MSKIDFKAIKAIVFDVDGTAVPNQMGARPSPRLIAAVAAAQPYIHLIPATGRPFIYAESVFRELGITGPVITSGGTNIIDMATGLITGRKTIPSPALPRILAILEPTPYDIIIEDEPKDTVRTGGTIRDSIDIIFIENVAEKDVPSIQQQLSTIPGIIASTVIAWGSGYTFNITSADATKEHAVREVLQKLHIETAQAVGVGDGDNDVHLFAAVGYKVAMGNATPTLQSAADEVIARVDEDGLAQLIERITAEAKA